MNDDDLGQALARLLYVRHLLQQVHALVPMHFSTDTAEALEREIDSITWSVLTDMMQPTLSQERET